MDKKTVPKDLLARRSRDMCSKVLLAYFVVMAVIYPFYAPGGYTRIGEVKYEFFRYVTLVALAALAGVLLLSAVVAYDKEWPVKCYRGMSVTDWFACGYFVSVMLSYLCSDYKEDALWGVQGWYMGALTQMMMVLLYFAFSRYYVCETRWIVLWMAAAAGVFALGICDRYSVYLIPMEGRVNTFISTLGNINWFCGYWSVTAPIGIALYWCSGRTRTRVLMGVYVVIALLSGLTQGSGSAYIVCLAMAAALFVLSLGSRRLYRFMELGMLFAGSCLLGKIIQWIPRTELNYLLNSGDSVAGIAGILLNGKAALGIMGASAVLYAALKAAERKGFTLLTAAEEKTARRMRMAVAVVLFAAAAAAALWIIKGAHGSGQTPDTDEQGLYHAVFDEDWGNGRGTAYNCGISAYIHSSFVHKMTGVGADCFADYLYSIPELVEQMEDQYAGERLTNAHNEWLTLLVNTGFLGLACYLGLFASAFVRHIRGASGQPLLYLSAICILTYTMNNIVSFQQVLSTPFVFIMTGIGEAYFRNMQEGTAHGQEQG